jgi:hypothetical protein
MPSLPVLLLSPLRMATYHSLRRTCPPGTRISSVRHAQYHRTPPRAYAYKDDQSKDSLNPRSTEYSKSGTDSEAAEQDQAFDPDKTSPEEQQAAADEESKGQTQKQVCSVSFSLE